MKNKLCMSGNVKRGKNSPLTVITVDLVMPLEPWEKQYYLVSIRRGDKSNMSSMDLRLSATEDELCGWLALMGAGVMGSGLRLHIISDIEDKKILSFFEKMFQIVHEYECVKE